MVRSEQLRVEEVSEARKAGVSTDEKTNIILEVRIQFCMPS